MPYGPKEFPRRLEEGRDLKMYLFLICGVRHVMMGHRHVTVIYLKIEFSKHYQRCKVLVQAYRSYTPHLHAQNIDFWYTLRRVRISPTRVMLHSDYMPRGLNFTYDGCM